MPDNTRILTESERRAAANGYEPGLLGAAMERLLAAQDAKTRRATVEEAKQLINARPIKDGHGYNLSKGHLDARDVLASMLAPPEPEMVEVIRFDGTTGMGNLTRSICIPLSEWERYAKGGAK